MLFLVLQYPYSLIVWNNRTLLTLRMYDSKYTISQKMDNSHHFSFKADAQLFLNCNNVSVILEVVTVLEKIMLFGSGIEIILSDP